jgi:hypothetical protein
MRGTRTGLVWLALVVAGCYSSYPLVEGVDADLDTAVDTADDPDADPDPDLPDVPDSSGTCGEIENPLMSVTFQVDEIGVYDDAAWMLTCRPPAASGTASDMTYTLTCDTPGGGTETHTLRILTVPSATRLPTSFTGDVVMNFVSQGVDMSFAHRWIVLRTTSGELILSLAMGDTLAPEGMEPDMWHAPLTILPIEGVCPIERPGCYDIERTAIDVSCSGYRDVIFEDQRRYLGPTFECYVHVGESFRQHGIYCSGTIIPLTYYSFLIIP